MRNPKSEPSRILIVDDDSAIRKLFHRLLGTMTASRPTETRTVSRATTDFGGRRFDLTSCSQAGEAVEAVRAALEQGRPFAAAYLDIRLPPGRSGIWAAERIRELDPDIELVIVTGYTDLRPSEIAERVPPADKLFYLRKPVQPAEIRQLSSALVAKWSAQRHMSEVAAELRNQVRELARANVSLMREINGQRRALQTLRRSEGLDRAIPETEQEAVFVLDEELQALWVNAPMARLLGGFNRGHGHRSLRDRLPPELVELLQRRAAECLVDGQARTLETYESFPARNLWLQTRFVPLFDSDDEPRSVLCVGQDVTAQRLSQPARRGDVEEQLRRSQKMAVMGRLASGVAHDFNNLLTVILDCSLSVGEMAAADPDIVREAEQIQFAALRASGLSRQLLTFSRRESTEPAPLDLNTLVVEMEKLLERTLGEDIRCTTQLSAQPALVTMDPGQVEQVLVNLAVNARDAMPRGGTLTIETATLTFDERNAPRELGLAPGRWVLLSVTDTGEGMAAEVQKHIFEPFFTTKRGAGGNGLGLATVSGIVRGAGGQIHVRSSPGGGASFLAYFPTAEDAVEPLGEDEVAAVGPPVAPEGGVVLLVEDDPLVRKVAGRMLRRGGFLVLDASNGEQALRVLESLSEPPTLLVSDVVMPDLVGPELVRRVRELYGDLPVLYISGYGRETLARRGVLTDDAPLLRKPFRDRELLRASHDAIRVGPERPRRVQRLQRP